METFFSGWSLAGDAVEGPMTRFGRLELPANEDLSAEFFAWVLGELIDEDECFLIVARDDGSNGYVQFHASEGGLWAEATSNRFLAPEHRLTEVDQTRLVVMGWRPPNTDWPRPPNPAPDTSPNFHRDWRPPFSTGAVAVVALRTLKEIFGSCRAGDLTFKFFRH